jgi:hypothetical protein
MKYLTLVIGILAIIISIYDSNSWAELRSNYLGLILGFGLLYKYYESYKSQRAAK